MTITELIAALEALRSKHGDLHVNTYDGTTIASCVEVEPPYRGYPATVAIALDEPRMQMAPDDGGPMRDMRGMADRGREG